MSIEKQRLWTMDYILVMISNFTAAFSYAAFNTILSRYVNDIGSTNAVAGAMAASMTIVMMISRPLFGNLIDRTGRRPVIRISGVLFALNTAVYMLPLPVNGLFAVRVLHGVSQSMYCVSTQTMVADVVPEERLVDGIGYFGVSSSLATALGPMIGLWVYEQFGASALFTMMTAFAALGAATALGIRANFKPERLPERRGLGGQLKGLVEVTALLPGLVVFCGMLCYGSASNFLSTCAVARGIPNISLFFTFASGAMILMRFSTGRITRAFGIFKPVAGGICLVAGSFVLLAFANSLPLMLIAGAIYGFGMGLVQPLLNVVIYRFCGPARRGAASATFGLLSDMGQGLGAAIWGVTTTSVGYTPTFLIAACCAMGGFGIHMTALRKKMNKEEIK